MSRMTITVDEALVEETRKALKARTKAEAIRQALEEALRRRRLERVLDHAGRVELDLDQGKLRRLREEG
jgi:Arc/MetJ family transcription regulator